MYEYPENDYRNYIEHSGNHKYIEKIQKNGKIRYIYPSDTKSGNTRGRWEKWKILKDTENKINPITRNLGKDQSYVNDELNRQSLISGDRIQKYNKAIQALKKNKKGFLKAYGNRGYEARLEKLEKERDRYVSLNRKQNARRKEVLSGDVYKK